MGGAPHPFFKGKALGTGLVSKVIFFQAKRSHCLTSSSVLGAGSLHVVSSAIIQMVSRGFTSYAGLRPVLLWYKVGKYFWHHACMKYAPPFSLQGFPTFLGNLYPYRLLETLIDNVKLNFFYLSALWSYYAYTYSFFDNISHTVWDKTAIHSLVCLLRSLLLTTCSVIVETSSAIRQSIFFLTE